MSEEASPITSEEQTFPSDTVGKGTHQKSEVSTWLHANNLSDYVEAFSREGFDDIEDLRNLLRNKPLLGTLVPKSGHQMKLRRLLLPQDAQEDRGEGEVSPPAKIPSFGAQPEIAARSLSSEDLLQSTDSLTSVSSKLGGRNSGGNSGVGKRMNRQLTSSRSSAVRTRATIGSDDLLSYKIIVVGEHGTGKTSYITRLVSNTFGSTQPTLGVDYREKLVHVDGVPVMLQLCDISGLERFCNLTRMYYQHSRAALVFYDRTSPATFERAAMWKADINKKVFGPDGNPIPCVMIGGLVAFSYCFF